MIQHSTQALRADRTGSLRGPDPSVAGSDHPLDVADRGHEWSTLAVLLYYVAYLIRIRRRGGRLMKQTAVPDGQIQSVGFRPFHDSPFLVVAGD